MFVAAVLACLATSYEVMYDSFTVGGLVAGDSQDAWIFSPVATDNATRFPVLSFGHGYSAGGDEAWCTAHGVKPPTPPQYPGPYCLPTYYHLLLADVAAAGFIVLAPASCPDQLCSNQYLDMSRVLTATQANRSLHPALWRANFSKVGLFGHSMGAINTARAIEHYSAAPGAAIVGTSRAVRHELLVHERAHIALLLSDNVIIRSLGVSSAHSWLFVAP
jgi:hypothetical protein